MSLKRLTDASRERILADPKEISLCFNLPDAAPYSFSDFLRQLQQLFRKKTSTNSPERDPHFGELECDLDKSWDVLCFLFCWETYGTGAYEKDFPTNFCSLIQDVSI